MLARLLSSLLVLLIGVCVIRSQSEEKSPISWHTNYKAAREEAKAKKRPLVILFITYQCATGIWSDKLQSNLQEAEVAKFGSDRFTFLKVGSGSEPKLVEFLGINTYPTTLIADCDGKILCTFAGMRSPQQLSEDLHQVLKKLEIAK